jgi:hypothetical protein
MSAAGLESVVTALDAALLRGEDRQHFTRGFHAASVLLTAHGQSDDAARAAHAISKLACTQWLDAHVRLGLAASHEAALVADVTAFVDAAPITTGTGRGGDELRAALEVLPHFCDVPSHPALETLVAAMCRWGRAGQRQSKPIFFGNALLSAVETCAALDRGTNGPWRAHASRFRDALLLPEERAQADASMARSRDVVVPPAPTVAEVLAMLAPPKPRRSDPFDEVLAPWRAGRANAPTLLAILRADPAEDERFSIRTPRAVFRDIASLDETSVREALALVLTRRFVLRNAELFVPRDAEPAIDARGYDDAHAHAVGALIAPWIARLGGEGARAVVEAWHEELARRGPPERPADWGPGDWRSGSHRFFETIAALAARGLIEAAWLDDLPEHAGWARWGLAGLAGLGLDAMHARWGEPRKAAYVVIVHRLAQAGRFDDALVMARVEDPYTHDSLGHPRVPTSHDTLFTLARSADILTPARAKALRAAMKKAKRFRTKDAVRTYRECVALFEALLLERGAT